MKSEKYTKARKQWKQDQIDSEFYEYKNTLKGVMLKTYTGLYKERMLGFIKLLQIINLNLYLKMQKILC